MILLDFSGTVFAALHVDIASGADPHKEYVRHLCLNMIRAYNKRFKEEFGEMTICLDSKSWRENVYEFYKWDRKQDRDGDDNDWSVIFEYITEIQDELRQNFPFPIIKVNGLEADDTMYHIAKHSKEPTLIISNDKDMVEATKFENVQQYRPYLKGMYVVDDPKFYGFELMMHGDKADGIPSVRCADDFLKVQYQQREAGTTVMRAPPINKKLKEAVWDVINQGDDAIKKVLGEENFKHFARNRQLIDMENTPPDLVDACFVEYDRAKQNRGNIMQCLNWMTAQRMNLLAREISDFSTNLTPKTTNLFNL